MQQRKTRLIAVLLAAALAAPAGFAFASPHGGHGHHHHGGFGQYGGLLSEEVRKQLNLAPEQDRDWQELKRQQQALWEQMRDTHQQMRAQIDAELAKPQPDLAAINAAMDAAHERNYAANKRLREAALGFYQTLTPDRQAIVVSALKERHERFKKSREHRHHGDRRG